MIFAEGKTATMMPHGMTDLVHANDVVNVDVQGHITLNPESGIKPGFLHHDISHGAGRGGAVDTSQFDQQIEAARLRGQAAEAWRQNNVSQLAEAAHASNEQAISGAVSANSRLWNMWLEKGVGNGFRPSTSAHEVWEGIKNLSPEVTSDHPMPATVDNILDREKVVGFSQELFKRFPVRGQETMSQYLERVSQTNFNAFNRLSKFFRL